MLYFNFSLPKLKILSFNRLIYFPPVNFVSLKMEMISPFFGKFLIFLNMRIEMNCESPNLHMGQTNT